MVDSNNTEFAFRKTVTVECLGLGQSIRLTLPGFIPNSLNKVLFIDSQKLLDLWAKSEGIDNPLPEIGKLEEFRLLKALTGSRDYPVEMPSTEAKGLPKDYETNRIGDREISITIFDKALTVTLIRLGVKSFPIAVLSTTESVAPLGAVLGVTKSEETAESWMVRGESKEKHLPAASVTSFHQVDNLAALIDAHTRSYHCNQLDYENALERAEKIKPKDFDEALKQAQEYAQRGDNPDFIKGIRWTETDVLQYRRARMSAENHFGKLLKEYYLGFPTCQDAVDVLYCYGVQAVTANNPYKYAMLADDLKVAMENRLTRNGLTKYSQPIEIVDRFDRIHKRLSVRERASVVETNAIERLESMAVRVGQAIFKDQTAKELAKEILSEDSYARLKIVFDHPGTSLVRLSQPRNRPDISPTLPQWPANEQC